MKLTKILVCVYMLTAAVGVFAQEVDETAAQSTEAATLTVKAKREVNDPKVNSLDTTIVTSEQIEATGASNVAEVLRYVAGVTIRDSVNSQVMQIRGGRYEQTLVLVNGQRQQAAQNLFMDLSQYNVANIERIEIIKGAAATRYGANAAAGVINIITKDRIKDAGKDFGLEVGVRTGNYGQVTTDILANTTYGENRQGNFFISGNITTNARNYMIDDKTDIGTFKGEVENNEIFNANVRLGNSYRFNEQGDILHASFNYFHENKNSPSSYYYGSYAPPSYGADDTYLGFLDDSGYQYKTHKYSGDVSYEHYSFEPFDFFVNASVLYQTVENLGDSASTHNSSDNITTEASFSIERTDKFGNGLFTFQNIAEVLYRNEYFIGGEVTLGTAVFAEGDTANRNTISIAYTPNLGFLNYEGTDVSRLVITPGIRFDTILGVSDIDSTEYENNFYEPTYSLGVLYTFDTERRYVAKANFATGYRAPTFNELYRVDTWYDVNPDIKTEHSLGGDIGFIVMPINMLTITGNYFINQYTDFITWSYDSTTSKYLAKNIDEYLSQGIDTSVALNVPINAFSSMAFTANYTYIFEAQGTTSGEGDFRMPFVPEHTANGVISYIFDGLSNNNILTGGRLNFLVNYSSEMFSRWDESVSLDEYYTFDLTASLTFMDYITVEGGIRNLLDNKYYYKEDFQAEGRNWYVGVRAKF